MACCHPRALLACSTWRAQERSNSAIGWQSTHAGGLKTSCPQGTAGMLAANGRLRNAAIQMAERTCQQLKTSRVLGNRCSCILNNGICARAWFDSTRERRITSTSKQACCCLTEAAESQPSNHFFQQPLQPTPPTFCRTTYIPDAPGASLWCSICEQTQQCVCPGDTS